MFLTNIANELLSIIFIKNQITVSLISHKMSCIKNIAHHSAIILNVFKQNERNDCERKWLFQRQMSLLMSKDFD